MHKKKCMEQGIKMFPGVEPLEVPLEDNLQQDGNIGSFMWLKPEKWIKEGLLKHIIELVVVEDKV